MKYAFLIFFALVMAFTAKAQTTWYFGTGEVVNLTNGTAYKNGVKTIAGSLDPSSTAVSAPSGSMYYSTSGTIYVKQDAGLTTNWLPLGIATTGSLTTINGQSGPNVSIATGTAGSDFGVSASSNTVTLDLPSASATKRGALSASDWTIFNNKEPAVTATTLADYYRGDKTFQPLNKAAVGLSNVDNTSDASKPISTATQAALNLKEDSIAAGTTSQYWRGDKSWQTLDKSAVGLSNVDNTSDANKPVSTATQTALDLKQDAATAATDTELTAGLATKEPTITILPLSKGGTNKNMTAVNGGVVYTDSDSQEVSAAGTSGQILKSNGAAAPTWINKSISGKAENLTAVTAETIVVPNNQMSLVGNNNEQLIETGNKNLLRNAGFEAFDGPFWTSTGTVAIGNNPLFGKAEAVVSVATSDLTIYQDSTLNAAQFADGVQGLASVWVKTSITSTPIYVCPRRAGVTTVSTSTCVTVQANGKWGLYKVPFILGGTSNGIDITSNSVSITSGSISIDEAFVGAVDLKQDINVIGQWQPYSPTFTGFGTVTCSGCFQWRQVGENVEIRGKFSSGTSTAVEARISLPNSYTSADTTIIPSIQMIGKMALNAASTTYFSYATLIEPSVTYMTIGRQSSTSSEINKINGSLAAASGDSFSLFASIPIANLKGASSVYTASCGANCVDMFSAKVSTTGTVSAENADWINGSASVATSTFTINLNSGIFTTSPNCTATAEVSGGTRIVTIVSTSSSSVVLKTWDDLGAAAAIAFQVFCQKQGADFVATRTIIGTFNEVMTTPGITKPKTCYYDFGGAGSATSPTNCTGTCVEYYDSCNAVSSVPTRSSTGIYIMSFSSGTFANSSPVFCSGAGIHRIHPAFTSATTGSSSTGGVDLTIYAVGNGGSITAVDTYPKIKCEGQAP